MDSTRELREKVFHDEWAKQTPVADIRVLEAFENITAQENRFIINRMGDLNRLRILDIGTGLGESAVYFALRGASVTANDISPAMLTQCLVLAKSFGVSIDTMLSSSSEEFDFGENQFDIVYGANVLHHIGTIQPFLTAVKRALTPRGRFFFLIR